MKISNRILSSLLVVLMMLLMIELPMTAYAAKPFAANKIPGIICAGDFDLGEKGETYSGYKTHLREGQYDKYRDDGSDMNIYQASSEWGNVSIGFNKNEWMVYTIEATQTATYSMLLAYTTQNDGAVCTFDIDDGAYNFNATLPNTGSWTIADATEEEIGMVTLTKGTHKLLIGQTGSGAVMYGLRFDLPVDASGSFAKNEGGYRETTIPTVIQAEDFDLGYNGSVSLDNKNNLRKYRVSAALDIGGKGTEPVYVHFNKGEAANYTVNCDYSGTYEINVNTRHSAPIRIFVDNSKFSYDIQTEVDGGYTTNHVGNFYLTKGKHLITLAADDLCEVDYIEVLKTDETGVTVEQLNEQSYPIPVVQEEIINDIYKELYVSVSGDDNNDGSEASPFATLSRAAAEVESLRLGMTGDIIVNIAGGDYKVEETIKLNENNAGRDGFNVIYRGDADDKPVFNGGTNVSGWKKHDEKIWSAPLTAETDIRQLYINDVEATRARSKYRYYASGNYTPDSPSITAGIKVNSRNFPCKFEHPEDMELVWDLEWKCNYTGVDSIIYDTDDGQTHSIVMDQPSWRKFGNAKASAKTVGEGARFYFSNAKELLDEPGEFFYDKHEGMIYYYPYSYEDMESADCYVGTTDLLFKAEGSGLGNEIDGLRLENLRFKYGAWNQVSELGLVVNQATSVKDPLSNSNNDCYEMPGQVTFNFARNVEMTNCDFQCLGSTAVVMSDDVKYLNIKGCIFTDIAGGGITVDDSKNDHNLDLTAHDRCTNITIENNIFRRIGTDYRASCAILGYYVKDLRVIHNDIRNIPYTGISVGWGWQNKMLGGIMANNEIAYNYIDDTNTPTHDGSQIYTLADQMNTTIHDNYMQRSGDYRGGIYLDEGSTNMKVYNNVVKDCHFWICARPNVGLKNITVSKNYSDTATQWVDSVNTTMSEHTVVTDGVWPDEAVEIMNNSGLEEEYKHLYDKIPYFSPNRKQIKDIPIYEYVTTDQNIVRAVDFLPGWGVGYYRSVGRGAEKNSLGTTYREGKIRDEEIHKDILISSSNWHDFTINNVEEDDFWCYTYDCKEEGEYYFWMKYLNGFPLSGPRSKVTVQVDGVEVISSVKLESTGDGVWLGPDAVTTFGKVYLEKGTHHVKIMTVDNGWAFNCWGFNKSEVTELSDVTIPLGNDSAYDELGYVDEAVPEVEVRFEDIIGHWAESDIEKMHKKKIINGVSQTLFAPEETLTLYQSSWLTLRCLGVAFTDDGWHEIAVEYGLLSSVTEADSPISRQRLASNIMNAYQKVAGSYTITVGNNLYGDMNDIASEYDIAVRGANAIGLLKGDTDGNFRPNNSLTRAEGAAVFNRLYSLLN